MAEKKKFNYTHLITTVISSIMVVGGFGIKEYSEEPKSGGNLNNFINNDYSAYKNWVSTQLDEQRERIRDNELYIAKQTGVASIKTIKNEQFAPYYYNGVVLMQNMLTKELFYDSPYGRKHAYYSKEHDFYYYKDINNTSQWCERK